MKTHSNNNLNLKTMKTSKVTRKEFDMLVDATVKAYRAYYYRNEAKVQHFNQEAKEAIQKLIKYQELQQTLKGDTDE